VEFTTQTFTVSDLYNWHKQGELNLSPRFQRRSVWSNAARSYLLDTVVRGLPMPKIYYRMEIDPNTVKSVREVVDGQQRLDALFNYVDGQFTVYRAHNPDVGGKRFPALTDEQKNAILSYEITADLLIGASDRLVLQIFSRINSYSVTLNAQERRNARFAGIFKTLAFDLGTEHLAFWLQNRILTDRDVARMQEAELTSELIIAMIDGMQDKKGSIDDFYENFEDSFPGEARVRQRFGRVLTWIQTNVGPEFLVGSAFRRRALFYSLFVAVADVLFGIPDGRGPIPSVPSELNEKRGAALRRNLTALSKAVRTRDPDPRLVEFAVASARQTDNIGPRNTRHSFILRAIRGALRA
jgi:hypothetical protein